MLYEVITMHNTRPPLFLGNVHIPPAGSPIAKTVDIPTRYDDINGVLTSITGPGHVFFGGDFNAHLSYTSTSASVSQGRLCGQDLSRCKLLNLANVANVLMCTGSVNGDLHNPPHISSYCTFFGY